MNRYPLIGLFLCSLSAAIVIYAVIWVTLSLAP